MNEEQLAALIADDDLGLLTVKPKRTPQTTEEEHLMEGFREILRFIDETGEAPSKLGIGINEKRLFTRLYAIRRDPLLCERLKPFDEYGVLTAIGEEEKTDELPPITIDDILNDAFLDSLDTKANEIFNLKHIPDKKDINSPDYVAQRRPCKDFNLFEEQLVQCQGDLRQGKRKLLSFANEQQIESGKFFVLHGVLLLVVEVGERTEKNGKWNARLRCIFENGTESDMLLRSLSSELYKDGQRVTELDENLLANLVVMDSDKSSGFIYILRSLSKHPDVLAIPNLYKIGLARRSIDSRIQNAANEPTYLMAPVAFVSTFQCYNVNLPKLENLLHRFFDEATAKIQVKDIEGNYSTPKEWFSVPLETIEAAVRLLISGEIVSYQYDPAAGIIVPRASGA